MCLIDRVAVNSQNGGLLIQWEQFELAERSIRPHELYRGLSSMGLPVETGSGSLTHYNRVIRQLPKSHWLDAACVGHSTPPTLKVITMHPLLVKATGHNNRQMCRTDRYGFPRQHKARSKVYFGFATGDLGRARVPRGKHAGTHIGRVVVRASGSFQVGIHDGISWKRIQLLQRADGYAYNY